jgi:uncharacterized protein YcfL
MTWAFKRQAFYVGFLVVFFVIFALIIIHPNLNQIPSCIDGKQNGNEAGVDCGGSCANACNYQVDQISVLWARSFEVVPGRFNAVAYLENHNKNTAINKISYRFRFADENNVYVGKREGTASIPPSGKFAIFEPGIDTGHSTPVYTTFQFTETPQWIQVLKQTTDQLQMTISNINLINVDTSPVLSATIKNNSLFIIPEVSIVAILYDADHNAISASSTFINQLSGQESKDITFTWPQSLPGKVVAEEIIPMYNVFSIKLK